MRSGGATTAPVEWGSGGQGGVTEPTKQGLLDSHALGSPRSQLTLSLPGQSSGGLFVTQPSAEPSASGQGVVGMPDLYSIWRFDGSISDQAGLQHLPSGFSTPAPSSAASAGWRLPGMDFGYSVKHPGEQGIPWIPFRGVAVGEPEGGINEQEAGPAAHVAAVLFDAASADFSKSLLSLKPPNGGADGK
ncbi:hypothetical protein EPH_0035270 [Eimeria praecox]|uniref:Uncharacterized protein n=1 Tax=Eimeria praecox TaxID=51316 RepID=U6G391_9EIME|nr:hypothetical protein EPH_0035270 [Eimeria praecox]